MSKTPVTAADVDAAAVPLKKGLERLSNLLGPNLPDELLAPVFDLTKKLGAMATKIEAPIKARVKALVEKQGAVFSEAGSRALTLAGWRMEIRPTGGGYDMDKLSALLRGKGLKRIDYMDVEKVYTLNNDKLQQLIGAKKVKEKELEACKNPPGFSVQTPTQAEDSDE